MVEQVILLQNGTLDLARSVLVAKPGDGQRLTVPVYSVLVKTDGGYILIDTGLHPNGITDPDGTWGVRAKTVRPTISNEQRIDQCLQRLGIRCEEIRTVVITHLHWDHTGGLFLFPHAKIVVQAVEHHFAFDPDPRIAGSYMRNHFDLDLDYELVEGDVQLCEGVDLLFTPGHTPGHQSVLLTLKNDKRCIIPGDAVYSYQNISEHLAPGNCWEFESAMQSLDKLITISKLKGAEIYPSHDPDLTMIARANSALGA